MNQSEQGCTQEVLDTQDLLQLLPHRFPMLLVDRETVLERGRRVVGVKRITSGDCWATGGKELPHMLVLEALAQTSSALVRDLMDGAEGAVAYFMGLDRVKLRAAARIGDELSMDLGILQWRRGVCRTAGVATVNGQLVASATLTTVVRGA